MSTNNVTVGIKLTVDGRDVQGALTLTTKQLQELNAAAGNAASGAGALDSRTSALTSTLSKYKTEMLALAQAYGLYKVGEYVKDATMLAARYETLGIVMRVAGNNAGYTGEQMEKYAQSLQKSGISMLASRDAMTQMAAAQLDVTKSQELGRIAQDLGVVSNQNSSETYKRLIQNIQQADTEGLKFMGITLNQTEAVNKYARANNLAADSLTPRQKAQAIMNEVMLQGAKYSGIYEEAMGTAGKALNSLDRYFENIKVKLGTPFLEGFAKGVFGVTDGVKTLNVFLDELEKNGSMEKFAKGFGSAVGTAIKGIMAIASVVGEIIDILKKVYDAADEMAQKFKDATEVMAAATVAFGIVLTGVLIDAAIPGFIAFTGAAWTMAIGFGAAMATMVAEVTAAGGLFAVGWAAIVSGATGVVAAIAAAFAAAPATVIAVVVALAVGIAAIFSSTVREKLKGMWTGVFGDGMEELRNSAADMAAEAQKANEEAATEQMRMEGAAAAAAKEAADAKLLAASKAAMVLVAIAEANVVMMKAVNDGYDQDLKFSLDQRVITQSDYLKKKQKMDLEEIGSQQAKAQAEIAALNAAMKVTTGTPRDQTADKAKMIGLLAQENVLGAQLNNTKAKYAQEIAVAEVDAYTKVWGSISSMVDAKTALLRTSQEEVENAGKTSEQLIALESTRAAIAADALEITLLSRVASKLASTEEVSNTTAMINSLKGLADAKAIASSRNFSATMVTDTKSLADETAAIYETMKNTFTGSEEERVRSAASASLRIMSIRKAEQDSMMTSKIGDAFASGDSAKAEALLAQREKSEDDFNAYKLALAANTDAKIAEASAGTKTLTALLNDALDPNKPVLFGQALAGAFGAGGDAILKMGDAFSTFTKKSEQYEAARKQAAIMYKDDQVKFAKAEEVINNQQLSDKMGYYASVAGAAKGFFKENTTAYKVMAGVEKELHLIQLAMQMEKLYTSLFVTTASAAGVVAGQAVETGAVIAGQTAQNAAKVPGVFMSFMSALGPWGAAAAAIAIAAVMGGVGGGGGGPVATTFEDRQKAQGTGTVLGDNSSKSNSVVNSLKIIEANSDLQIGVQNGMLSALKGIESALGGAAKGLLQTTGITGGSAFGTVNQSDTSFFGADTSTTLTDSGVNIRGTFGQLRGGHGTANQYEDVTKTSDGGWFSGNSTDSFTNTKALSADAMKPFAMIFDSLGTALVDAGSKLGKDSTALTDALNQIDVGFTVSLRNLKGQDLVDALNAGISVAFDQVATSLFPEMEKFQKVGEGLGDTLIRVATGILAVDSNFKDMGKTIASGTVDGKQNLIDLAGGLEEFTSKNKSFMEKFYTDTERNNMTLAKISPMLSKVGIDASAAGATKAFRDLVLSVDTMTPAGAELYTSLMNIQGSFLDVASAADAAREEIAKQRQNLQDSYDELTMTSIELREKERNKLDESNRALYDSLNALRDYNDALKDQKTAATALVSGADSAFTNLQNAVAREKTALTALHDIEMKNIQGKMDAVTKNITKEKALADALASTLNSMKGPGQDVTDRAAAQAQIKAALAAAQAGGGLPDVETLKKALSAVSSMSTDGYATQADYLKDLYSTKNDVADLGALADHALTTDQQALQVLTDQKDLAQKTYDDQMANLTNIIDSAKEQIDLLKGIDKNMLTVAKAMPAFMAAMQKAMANPINAATAATPAITQAYQTSLHRDPEAGGLQFYQNAAASGTSLAAIADEIANSTEAKLNTLYRSVLGRAPDQSGLDFWVQAFGQTMDASEEAAFLKGAEPEMRAKEMKVPGFAAGGDFGGGMRLVGENGPEMEITGPSRIINNNDLMSQLSSASANNDVLVEAVKRLTDKVADLQRTNSAENMSIAKSARTVADVIESSSLGQVPLIVKVAP